MTTERYLTKIINEFSQAIKPLTDSLSSKEDFTNFLAWMGWALDESSVMASIQSSFDAIRDALDELQQAANDGKGSADLVQLVSALISAISGLTNTNFHALPRPLNQAAFWQDFPDDVLEMLMYLHLERRHPFVFGIFSFIGVLTKEHQEANSNTGRLAYDRMGIEWERISQCVYAPQNLLKDVYGWGSQFKHRDFMSNLAALLVGLRASAQLYPANDRLMDLYHDAENPYRSEVLMLAASPYQLVSQGGDIDSLLKVLLLAMPVPPKADRLSAPEGLLLFPLLVGNAAAIIPLQDGVELAIGGGFEAEIIRILFRPSGVSLETPLTGGLQARTNLHILRSSPLIIAGEAGSTRVEFTEAHLSLGVKGPINDLEYLIEAAIDQANLVLDFSESDGFLQKLLGSAPQNIALNFGIAWSNRLGLVFLGQPNLDITLSVHLNLFDVINIDTVFLSFKANMQTKSATAIASLSGRLTLGPIKVNVDRVGISTTLLTKDRDHPGNLGTIDFVFGFKPPSGAGMAIDASAVVGGGYLFFDPDNEQYAGILQLEIQKIVSLKAIGLLTTRMPDGSKGFSLLVIISAEFPAIQLGFGFTLTGVGGLLGVNRTMVVDVLRNGLRNGTLGSILFPQNPVEHAQKIISDLRSIFPVAPMRFVFGPVARLGWGTNNLIIAELGILLELPKPIRLVILGRLTLALPNEKSPVVLIHLDSLGVIDFDRGDVSLDATIYDSKIAMFALTGDMALRLNWGLSPTFAVAVGGFNPRFQPPPNFPQLNRLAISLATSDNPRIRLETYLALTANTFQFGARLDFYVEVSVRVIGTFSASAYLGFDALVQMAPLQFIVDIDGGVAIKHNGYPLFSASLHLSLSGPEPVHAWGEATFAFLGERRIPFDLTISAGMIQPPLLPADPLQKLIEELEAKANWSAQLPRDENMLVTLRKIEVVDEILAHPLGELAVGQKAVPLEVMITRFGNSSPTQSGPFRITFVQMGDQVSDQPRQTLRALYTPGQFFEMSDEEKLARPAFEALPSGCSRIGTTAIRHSATQVKAIAQYDTVVVDKLEERHKRTDAAFAYTLPSAVQAALAGLGAAGQSAMRATGSAKYVGSDQQQVKLADPAYVVTSTDDMNWQKTDKKPTYTEAEAVRQQKGAPNGRYQVVGAHEVR